MRLSKEEMEVLYPIYIFQKKRHFRFGLNKKYAIEEAKFRGVENPERVIQSLIRKDIIFVKEPYKDKSYQYLFLTKKGRKIFEREYKRWLGLRRSQKVGHA